MKIHTQNFITPINKVRPLKESANNSSQLVTQPNIEDNLNKVPYNYNNITFGSNKNIIAKMEKLVNSSNYQVEDLYKLFNELTATVQNNVKKLVGSLKKEVFKINDYIGACIKQLLLFRPYLKTIENKVKKVVKGYDKENLKTNDYVEVGKIRKTPFTELKTKAKQPLNPQKLSELAKISEEVKQTEDSRLVVNCRLPIDYEPYSSLQKFCPKFFKDMSISIENKFQENALSSLDTLCEKRPEIGKSLDYNLKILIKYCDSKEMSDLIVKNAKILEEVDKSFIEEFNKNNFDINIERALRSENLDLEKYNLVKSYIEKEDEGLHNLKIAIKIAISNISTKTLEKLLKKTSDTIDPLLFYVKISSENTKLVEAMLDDNFDLADIEDVIDIHGVDRYDAVVRKKILENRLAFYNDYKNKNEPSKQDLVSVIDGINIAKTSCNNENIPQKYIVDILGAINKNNNAYVCYICNNPDIPKDCIADILNAINKENNAYVCYICNNPDIPKAYAADILRAINKDNNIYVNKVCNNSDVPKDCIASVLRAINKDNETFVDKLYNNSDIPRKCVVDILKAINKNNIIIVEKLYMNKNNNFSIEQKLTVLKTYKANRIQDENKFIDDVYYGVQQGCSVEASCVYAKIGNMYKSMKIRENIMKYQKSLKQHDVESDEKAIDRMLTTESSTAKGKYDGGINAIGLEGAYEILKITDMATIENATQLKFTGFKNFLLYGTLLSKLSHKNQAKLKDVLEKIPYPEQRVQKIQIITSLIGNISEVELTSLINNIEIPNMTFEQKCQVEKIFSQKNKKSYSEKIYDFIKEFNVPETKIVNIKKWLIGAKLDTKFVVPKPIELQINEIDRKIANNERILNLGKVPKEKVRKMRASNETLKKIRGEMLANPKKYTVARLNYKTMQELDKQVRDNINYPNQTKTFIENTCKLLYKKMGIENPPKYLLDAINYDFKYFARIFAGLDYFGWHSDFTFKTEFTKLINLIMENPGKKLTEARMSIPENQKTKKMFEENGLDFEYWNKFDDNFKQECKTLIERDKAIAEVLNNLKNELNTDLFKTFDEIERKSLLAKIDNAVATLPKTENFADNNLKEAKTIIEILKQEFEENEYWKKNAKMFKDHIDDYLKKVHDVKDVKDREVVLYVRLSDSDDIGRNIFFGDHVGCCTSSGGGNGFAAAQHLMNSFVRGYELVDNKGVSYGNSMCFFAKVDGKLTFVIDSFEANGQLASSKEVPDALIEFAHIVCKREGRPDAQIMFGPSYNHLNAKNRLSKTKGHTIEIIGTAPSNTYIDSMEGYGNINEPLQNGYMNEIVY